MTAPDKKIATEPAEENFRFENIRLVEAVVSAEWKVPVDLKYLNGHFPGSPMVPGAILVEVSWRFLKYVLRKSFFGKDFSLAELKAIKSAKFLSPVTPGAIFMLSVEREEEIWRLRWKKFDDRNLSVDIRFILSF